MSASESSNARYVDTPFDGLRASRACRGTLHEERAIERFCDESSRVMPVVANRYARPMTT